MKLNYEFRPYDAEGNELRPVIQGLNGDSAARSKAGSMAKRNGGPVDLARVAGGKDWAERYLTTANPSEYHRAGYRFERLG